MQEQDEQKPKSSETPTETPPESPTDSFEELPANPAPKNWKTQLHQIKNRVSEKMKSHMSNPPWKKDSWNKEAILKAIQNFDPQTSIDWASKLVQKRGAAFYGTLLTIVLSTYFLADLSALLVGEYLPSPPVARVGRYGSMPHSKTLNDYNTIFSRNLFNSKGLIPGDEIPGGTSDLGGPPVKSSLPMNLIGTLILTNEALSIATIEDKSSSNVYPVRMDDEIPDKIKVLKVEPRRVIFINKASGRREYLELPEDAIAMNPRLTPGRPTSGAGVEKVAPTQYNVSRSEVDKALADFNNILTQARAVPNFENGVAAGYKLFQIVPGSIYDKLGLQNGDVISGLNGQPINDPGKAFEMLNELKMSNHLELQVKKDGKQMTYTYDIH